MLDYIPLTMIPVFLLIFVRILAFLIALPLFSYQTIPNLYKIGFAFFLAVVMYSSMDTSSFVLDNTYVFLLAKEALVGLLISALAYIIMSTIQIAGGFIDFQMGFAIANVIDPQTGAQSPLTGQYFYLIAMLFLLSVNGHHILIDGIYHSFEFIPIDEYVPFGDENIINFVIDTFNKMFLMAFQMSIPIVGCLFLVDVALGLIARTVPQVNVFVVGLPLKIFVSFVVIFFFLGLYMMLTRMLFDSMFVALRDLMDLLGGG